MRLLCVAGDTRGVVEEEDAASDDSRGGEDTNSAGGCSGLDHFLRLIANDGKRGQNRPL